MNGRDFLPVARELSLDRTEAHSRAAVGRAYYAVMLEGRTTLAKWGFGATRYDQIHSFVRQRFNIPADADLKVIGQWLDGLGRLRNRADYELAPGVWFSTAAAAKQSIYDATAALDLLDEIDADPARRAAAAAAIRAAFP